MQINTVVEVNTTLALEQVAERLYNDSESQIATQIGIATGDWSRYSYKPWNEVSPIIKYAYFCKLAYIFGLAADDVVPQAVKDALK